MNADRKHKIIIRPWEDSDIPALVECHRAVYSDYDAQNQFDERVFGMQYAAFPEGQFLAEVDGRVVGYATSIIVQLDDDQLYTYTEITGGGTFSTHEPSGDTLYGADIGVHPDFRGKGIAGRLYQQRKRLLRRFNLRRMLAYGRIPGYSAYAGRMTADQYVKAVIAGEVKDSALNAHLKAGYEVRKVLLDFVSDRSSLHYATLLEMPNPGFKSERRKIAAQPLSRPVRHVRVCAAQFEMRTIHAWEEFARSVEFFVVTADMYHCHFVVLPEYCTAQLFSIMPEEWDERRCIEQLADMADRYVELLGNLARKYRMYIVGGSIPVRRDGKLFNVSHFLTPSGKSFSQDKLHITPSERDDYGICPGEAIRVFDTPYARVAVQICYDIEFPEVARLLTLHGVEMIFVPFSTDEKKAYQRVRCTAQARAVENYIYVVIAGNVGNLPFTKYLINYGQAAILTPSDFAFPPEAIAGEADPNAESVVISDLDLSTLALQREVGSVRPLYDRRPDLYQIRSQSRIEVIPTD